VIGLEAAPVHLADLKHIHGLPWFDQYSPPHSPGYEGVGRIVSVGPGVEGWRAGDRVFLPVRFGAWRERVLAAADGLWRAPEHIDAAQLALLPINLTTAWVMLNLIAPLRAGDWIIQNAANSNVSYYVMRLARRMGIKTLNVVRRADLFPALDAAGADICLLDGPDLGTRARSATGGAPICLAFDSIAGTATARLAAAVDPGGTVAVIGLLSGEPCQIKPELLMFGKLSLKGLFTADTIAEMSAAEHAAMRLELDRFVGDEPLATPIAGTYPFERIRDAARHAARTEAGRDGKIIITPR
jgi:NADPH:quinone reductase-like Zn-dependent oxidoreductase